ncbi:sensor histidine kinase [Planotetraspora kaengkrachanensis]|uniref:histidine kinase n=1 Tax=Planotetraspora kaengkrachanensis TaxID=575193 RepID=A0A8J3PR53_9ACTN|nr:histidine kinase [Planotetraspora kaengkrachanensis]GIG78827.1 two-component sensor histidine kinase [Planotetraspora kaengkrachanensis]
MDVVATRRSTRDWIVDTCLFLFAVAFGLLTASERVQAPLPEPAWVFGLDQIVATLGCAALWLRRSRPVELCVVLIALAAFSELVSGAMLVALFTVAVHRPPRTTGIVFGLSLVSGVVYVELRPEPAMPGLLLFLLGLAIQGAIVGWGLFIHHRRELVVSLRDRAARAETEAHLRAEQAQLRTREAIAREMHDVLGHRLSLLSVHAGALEYRPDAPPEDVARAAKVIRESAHQALQDLREVIGVLRAPVGELPQPTFADIHQLVAESVEAGMRVDLRQEIGGQVPDGMGRTAYRVVQEGLTNARKHATGAGVRLRAAGAPGQGLTVEVGNTAPDAEPVPRPAGSTATDAPGGQGLLGLAERVALAGGRLEHGPTGEGGWRLAAWLPWPT